MKIVLLIINLSLVVFPVWHIYNLNIVLVPHQDLLLYKMVCLLISLILAFSVSLYENRLSFLRVAIPSMLGILLMQLTYEFIYNYIEQNLGYFRIVIISTSFAGLGQLILLLCFFRFNILKIK